MNNFLKLIGLLSLSICLNTQAASLYLDPKIKDGKAVEFLKFSGPGEYDNYLTMNLPFAPIKHLFEQVQEAEGLMLKSRGEAHITVLTPVEYWNILKPLSISISDIDQLAESMQIQSSRFEVRCLGMGKAMLHGKEEKTFFVVVESDDLLEIRRRIQKLVIAKGGAATDFDPNHFYPHITVGYTTDDLHEKHGVIKNLNSCVYVLN